MKKDQRLIQSEKAIIEAGIQTLTTNPSAGMSDIAVAAGVGRATLYRHFESKEALIQQIVVTCLGEIDTATGSLNDLRGRHALEATIDAVVPIADRFRFLSALWGLVHENEAINRIVEQQFKDLCDLVDDAKRMGEIDDSLPTKWVATTFDGILGVAWDLIESEAITPDEASGYAKRTFFSGCSVGL